MVNALGAVASGPDLHPGKVFIHYSGLQLLDVQAANYFWSPLLLTAVCRRKQHSQGSLCSWTAAA